MGDRTSVSIIIGGALPRAAFAQFVEAIEADAMKGDDWMSAATGDEVSAAAEKGEILYLAAHEVNYANLDEVEGFCREHRLPYRKQWDQGGEYGAGGEYFDGETVAEYLTTGTDGRPALDALEIRELGSWEAVIARLDKLSAAIPAFELTGEWPAEDADD